MYEVRRRLTVVRHGSLHFDGADNWEQYDGVENWEHYYDAETWEKDGARYGGLCGIDNCLWACRNRSTDNCLCHEHLRNVRFCGT